MSPPDDTPAPPDKPPGSGPRFKYLLDQMAAWMRDRLAADALTEEA